MTHIFKTFINSHNDSDFCVDSFRARLLHYASVNIVEYPGPVSFYLYSYWIRLPLSPLLFPTPQPRLSCIHHRGRSKVGLFFFSSSHCPVSISDSTLVSPSISLHVLPPLIPSASPFSLHFLILLLFDNSSSCSLYLAGLLGLDQINFNFDFRLKVSAYSWGWLSLWTSLVPPLSSVMCCRSITGQTNWFERSFFASVFTTELKPYLHFDLMALFGPDHVFRWITDKSRHHIFTNSHL